MAHPDSFGEKLFIFVPNISTDNTGVEMSETLAIKAFTIAEGREAGRS